MTNTTKERDEKAVRRQLAEDMRKHLGKDLPKAIDALKSDLSNLGIKEFDKPERINDFMRGYRKASLDMSVSVDLVPQFYGLLGILLEEALQASKK